MSEDVLSGLLRRIRLRGALFFNVECVGAWVIEAPASELISSAVMPASEHLMEYHVLLGGSCWTGITGEQSFQMNAGDVVLFPHGDAHVMSSAPGLRAEPDLQFLIASLKRRAGRPFRVRQQDGRQTQLATPRPETASHPPTATLLCGFLGCDRGPFNPLLTALPRVIHARASELSEDSWAGQLGRLAEAESLTGRPGGEAVLERMSEMMFVDLVRLHLSTLPKSQAGWLSALQDRHIGRVLSLMHSRPAEAWTLEKLSGHVTCFDALHDMGDPVGTASQILKQLKPDGTWMVVEPMAADELSDNFNPVGRLFYAASTSICVPTALAQRTGLALGAQAGECKLTEVIKKGGFRSVRRAAETPFNIVLEARA